MKWKFWLYISIALLVVSVGACSVFEGLGENFGKAGDSVGIDTRTPVTGNELQEAAATVGAGVTATMATGIPAFLIISVIMALAGFLSGRVIGAKKPAAALDGIATAVYELGAKEVALATRATLDDPVKKYLTARLDKKGINLLNAEETA